MSMNNIFIIGALPRSLLNFRGELIRSLIAKGNEVTAMAFEEDLDVTTKLNKLGVPFKLFPARRTSFNPFFDLKTLFSLFKILKKEKPNIIFSYTIKPVIWGGIASRVIPNVRFYGLITGLGFAFQKKGVKQKILTFIVTTLYKIALSNSNKVIFQNPDNLQEFISRGIVPHEKCVLVNGSGIDINYFSFTPLPNKKQQKVIFFCIARLLNDKGLREYYQAAKIVKEIYPNVIFRLLGGEDNKSPDHIPISEVKGWQKKGVIEYLGYDLDVRVHLRMCHIFVLPSYHEGLPRTILEAMATGRPILTTDVPGCRETVINGLNGYLIPKKDINTFSERMLWFIENQDQWAKMGIYSRKLAKEKFNVSIINEELCNIMKINMGE